MLSPRGQSGLEAKILASASKLWPRPRGFGLGQASVSLSYYVIAHFSCKNRVKFANFVLIFPAIILNHMLVVIIWYFFIIIFGLGLDLIVLASASASRFWFRLASLNIHLWFVVDRHGTKAQYVEPDMKMMTDGWDVQLVM